MNHTCVSPSEKQEAPYPKTPILDALGKEIRAIIAYEEHMGCYAPIVEDDTYITHTNWRTDDWYKVLMALNLLGEHE